MYQTYIIWLYLKEKVQCVIWFTKTKLDVQTLQLSTEISMERIQHKIFQFVDSKHPVCSN